MINPNDIHYEYNVQGYMVYYKDKPIYGAGIDKIDKRRRSNLKLFREEAELVKRQIVNGFMGQDTKDRIKIIDLEETKDEEHGLCVGL